MVTVRRNSRRLVAFSPIPIGTPVTVRELCQRTVTGVPMGIGENATSLREFRGMVTIGKAYYVQPAYGQAGHHRHGKSSSRGRASGRALRTERLLSGTGFSSGAALPRGERESLSHSSCMFADFGATPFAKTVPVINGGVEVPQGPGLGTDPEDDLIAQFRV